MLWETFCSGMFGPTCPLRRKSLQTKFILIWMMGVSTSTECDEYETDVNNMLGPSQLSGLNPVKQLWEILDWCVKLSTTIIRTPTEAISFVRMMFIPLVHFQNCVEHLCYRCAPKLFWQLMVAQCFTKTLYVVFPLICHLPVHFTFTFL